MHIMPFAQKFSETLKLCESDYITRAPSYGVFLLFGKHCGEEHSKFEEQLLSTTLGQAG